MKDLKMSTILTFVVISTALLFYTMTKVAELPVVRVWVIKTFT